MGRLDYGGGKMFLAPMVRVGTLPMRLLALEYGADLVWSPELVDKMLLRTRRIFNHHIGTIDYVYGHGDAKMPSEDSDNVNSGEDRVVFRTHPSEKSRLVLQLGSASPALALKAAQLVAEDVSGIDLNCGCPMHFSTHSGMGAALLSTPDILVGILEALTAPGALPSHISVSAKIRVLPTAEETLSLVRRIAACNVSALTVHCRLRDERPRFPAHRELLPLIVKVMGSIPVIANGDLWNVPHAQRVLAATGAASAMFARAAQWDPSLFSRKCRLIARKTLIDLRVASLGESVDIPPSALITFTSNDATTSDNSEGSIEGKSTNDFNEVSPFQYEEDLKHHIIVTRRYLELALKFDNPFGNSKYTLMQMWLTRPRPTIMTPMSIRERSILKEIQKVRDYDALLSLFS